MPLRYISRSGLLYQSDRKTRWTSKGEIAEDLTYNDKSLSELYLLNNKIGDIANNMTKDELAVNKAIYNFTLLFDIFSINADARMKMVIDDMLNHFRYGKGEDYINSDLSSIVVAHPSSQRFIQKNYCNIINWLIDYNGDLDIILMGSRKKAFEDVGTPKYKQLADYLNGLKICIDDTWGVSVEIYDYKFDEKKFSGTIRYTIYDHFGLDSADVSQDKTTTKFNFGNIYGEVDGFASWYVLQHYYSWTDEFVPFVDYVIIDVPFEGGVDDEKKDYESNKTNSNFYYNIVGLLR